MELRNFINPAQVEIASSFVLAIVVVGVVYRLLLWRRVIAPGLFRDVRRHLGLRGLGRAFLHELGNRVLIQRNVIIDSKLRWFAHFCIFWGFIGLAIATTLVYLYDSSAKPRSLLEPAKLFGNGGGLLLMLGCGIVLGRLTFVKEFRMQRSTGDALFFILLLAAGVTGFTTEFARIMGIAGSAYFNYAVHLGFVALLLASAPFTHFFHAISTPAMRFVERLKVLLQSKTGRKGIFRDYYKEEAMLKQVIETLEEKGP